MSILEKSEIEAVSNVGFISIQIAHVSRREPSGVNIVHTYQLLSVTDVITGRAEGELVINKVAVRCVYVSVFTIF